MQSLYLIIPLAPLVGALVSGLLCLKISNRAAHTVTILGMVVSTVAAAVVFYDVLQGHTYNGPVYTWLVSGETEFEIGFLIDRLSALMMLVVTFVSLMVHVYTIGYMPDDPGYNRFFSYISLFTFSMLMLVMANNFLQLFFGWEAVGLVSYLLIGFWYTRPTAIYANLKAFLVNRVGDFGFLLGIALVLMYFGTLDYATVFANAGTLSANTIEIFPGHAWSLMTVICILLFIGAMGKSAQFPLHVWLPDSMEGPTPISALIHAATMVTAGIFMVARMSPLFELSETALSFVLVIGAITAFFMALIAMTQYDIKRVVAYSTLSQLGYMTMALGASAYSVGDFPPDDARVLQGGAVPRRGFGDHRAAPRAGHAQDGRAAQIHADHLPDDADRRAGQRRLPAVRRFLLQGHHHRGGARFGRRAGRGVCLSGGARRGVRRRLLFVPAGVFLRSTARSAFHTHGHAMNMTPRRR